MAFPLFRKCCYKRTFEGADLRQCIYDKNGDMLVASGTNVSMLDTRSRPVHAITTLFSLRNKRMCVCFNLPPEEHILTFSIGSREHVRPRIFFLLLSLEQRLAIAMRLNQSCCAQWRYLSSSPSLLNFYAAADLLNAHSLAQCRVQPGNSRRHGHDGVLHCCT